MTDVTKKLRKYLNIVVMDQVSLLDSTKVPVKVDVAQCHCSGEARRRENVTRARKQRQQGRDKRHGADAS